MAIGAAWADGAIGGPLLIIAGAGLGQDQHARPSRRAPHRNGADPRRILLMTFSRRAASEMAKRVERICRQVLGTTSRRHDGRLHWAGTFHGIGARLLREYAEQIGLDRDSPSTTAKTAPT
jgi:DNA helicase-2/ATP-dependent DNA helicase PcrA